MNTTSNERRRSRRPWADLPLDLLNLIYSKLPPDEDHSEFGSVCKNWRQFHVTIRPGPPSPRNSSLQIGAQLGQPILKLDRRIPTQTRNFLYSSSVISRWKENDGWLVLCHRDEVPHYAPSFDLSCFNPLLPWPSCFIRLPYLLIHDVPITAALSASPGSSDWTMLVLHSGCNRFGTLCTHRNGDGGSLKRSWWNYKITGGGDRGVCVGMEFMGGKFYAVFNNGDVLIVGIGEESAVSELRMLVAEDPLFSQGQLGGNWGEDIVRAVGESVVVSWRVRRGRKFRLVSVEGSEGVDTAELESEMEEGRRRRGGGGGGGTGYLVREDREVRISKDRGKKFNMLVAVALIVWLLIAFAIGGYALHRSHEEMKHKAQL